jgi:hypothetical protein
VVAALLKDTSSVFAGSKNILVDQRASIETISNNASKGMQQIHNLEEVSAERIVKAINSDGEQCTNHCTKGVLQGAKDNIFVLTAIGSVDLNTLTEPEESEERCQPTVFQMRLLSHNNDVSISMPKKKKKRKSTITKQKGRKSEAKQSVQKGDMLIKTKRAWL